MSQADLPLADLLPIGYTGTRNGMTAFQVDAVANVLRQIDRPFWAHHGDCVGGDSQFHALARATSLCRGITGHPPRDPRFRAYCVVDLEMPPGEYLVRDRAIVAAASVMIAGPAQPWEVMRSGTWATVREARRKHRKGWIVLPNGTLVAM